MRRFTKLLITLLLIGCAIVACSKDQTYSLKVPSESILVSMPGDTGSTNFDSQNITSITVTSTPEGWTVDNIDMYSGFVYRMLGIPEELFTPLFAVSRMAGWCAHRFEEINSGKRIIRPAYKSVSHEKKYIDIKDR